MGVQWNGAAASAAAADLERHVRSLDAKGKWRPGPVHHAAGAALSVLLPWLVFIVAAALLVAGYQERAMIVWGGVCGMAGLCLLLTFGGLAMGRTAIAVLGLWSLASMAFGVFMGRYVNTEYMQIYWKIRSSGPGLVGVDPTANEVASLGDEASIVGFSEGSFVDDLRTIGYVAKGSIYCVAPVVRRGRPSAPVAFWAAGIGCCERRSNFDCGSARLPGALTALSYTSEGDRFFAEAVKEAASVYGLAVAQHSQRVFFEGDPAQFLDDLWREAFVAAVLAAAFHLCTCIIVSTALQKTGIRWVGGTGGLPFGEPIEERDMMLRGGARGKDRKLTASKVRTILDPQVAFAEEKQERSCFGCGPRHYWVWRSPKEMQCESMEKEIWFEESRRLDAGYDPCFLDKIVIAEDGGFNEVPRLMKSVDGYRYLTALTTIGLILFNICYILVTDAQMINSTGPGTDMYLLTSVFIAPIVGVFLHNSGVPSSYALRSNVLVPAMEISVLVFALSWVAALSVEAALAEARSHRRWKNLSRVFFTFPGPLSSFSAMSLLHYVTPSVLVRAIVYTHATSNAEPFRAWLRFILLRSMAFMIGFDAFLMKFRATAEYVEQDAATLQNLARTAGFLLQLLGIVQVSLVVRMRLLRAFFGGEEASVKVEDVAKEVTYHALLAREMYRHSASDSNFVAMMLSFSDEDFQGLMLNSKGSRSGTGSGSPTKDVEDIQRDLQSMAPQSKYYPAAI